MHDVKFNEILIIFLCIIFDAVQEQILADLQQALDDGVDDVYRLQQVIRRTIGAWVSRRLRRRPMIVPVVVAT